jgi:rSAM/selenodomain-associated transferase 2/rSAM/selenodomain-associated transferase 1
MSEKLSLNRETCLVVMVKYPEPGKVKTRLGREIGMDNAARFYRDFVFRLLTTCSEISCPVVISCHPDRRVSDYQQWLGHEYAYIVQRGNDLGMIMQDSFEQAFDQGFSKVILLGSDVPHLPGDYIEKAVNKLEENDLVIGPALDGGYYLLGMNKTSFNGKIFKEIPWSTSTVFILTLKVVAENNLTKFILPCLRDIDTLDDLNAVWNDLNMTEEKTGNKACTLDQHTEISVIIPVYKEQEEINSFLKHVKRVFPGQRHEIIIVDGSPGLDTLSAVNVQGVKAISSDKGRGKQMNTGASVARGRVLLFLHSDTLLPENASELILDAFKTDENIMAGAFSLGIDSRQRSLKLIEKAANLRSCLTRVPYGDQGIFIREDFFREIGGFPEIPIMEDLELMTRIRKQGHKIAILPEKSTTSPRRWEKEGTARCTLRNWLIRILYHFGVSADTISRYYK